MERKTCNIIRDVLPLYIDDVVCEDTREWVEKHLAECPECAEHTEKLRGAPVIPVNADAHVQIMDELKNLQRMLKKRWFKTAVIAVICVLTLVVAALCWLMFTVEVIEYDGSNIAIEESENGDWLMLRYYGRGDVLWSAGTVPETGETDIVVTQRMWDRYIDPIYDGSSGRYYLMDSDMTLIIREQETGEILWEADEEQAARFYARQEKLKETNPEYFDLTGE